MWGTVGPLSEHITLLRSHLHACGVCGIEMHMKYFDRRAPSPSALSSFMASSVITLFGTCSSKHRRHGWARNVMDSSTCKQYEDTIYCSRTFGLLVHCNAHYRTTCGCINMYSFCRPTVQAQYPNTGLEHHSSAIDTRYLAWYRSIQQHACIASK